MPHNACDRNNFSMLFSSQDPCWILLLNNYAHEMLKWVISVYAALITRSWTFVFAYADQNEEWNDIALWASLCCIVSVCTSQIRFWRDLHALLRVHIRVHIRWSSWSLRWWQSEQPTTEDNWTDTVSVQCLPRSAARSVITSDTLCRQVDLDRIVRGRRDWSPAVRHGEASMHSYGLASVQSVDEVLISRWAEHGGRMLAVRRLLPPAQCSASKQRSVLVFRYGAAGGDIPRRLAFAVG